MGNLDTTQISVKFKEWDLSVVERVAKEHGLVVDSTIPELRIAVMKPEVSSVDTSVLREQLHARDETERATFPISLATRANYHNASTEPLEDHCFHLKRTNVFQAWKYTRGSSQIRLGVVDTGLSGLIQNPPGETAPLGDLMPPEYFFDAVTESTTYRPDHSLESPDPDDPIWPDGYSHGTSVWSVVKAARNNAGISGVAPNCYGIFGGMASSGGGLYSVNIAKALVAVANQDPHIISCSWGAEVPETAEDVPNGASDVFDAMVYAQGRGCLIVAASGNANEHVSQPNHYVKAGMINLPGDVNGVINVSSAGGPAPHTYDTPWNGGPTFNDPNIGPAYGAGIDIVAPSRDTFMFANPIADSSKGFSGPGPNWGYGGWEDGFVIANGQPAPGLPRETHHHSTSFAAPQVAGILALIWSVNPALTQQQVKDILLSTMTAGRHPDFATRYPYAGMVNAGKGVKKALATLPDNAGHIFPYLGFDGVGVTTTVTAGAAATDLNGELYLDIAGFSNLPVDTVELWVGPERIYQGSPSTLKATAAYSGLVNPIKVVAKSGGVSAEEIYDDIRVTSISFQAYAVPGTKMFHADTLQVSLGSTRMGSMIRYTTDGSEPNGSSPVYVEPITLSATTTLKYFAVDQSNNTSPVVTETFTKVTPPAVTIDPAKFGSDYNTSDGYWGYITGTRSAGSTVVGRALSRFFFTELTYPTATTWRMKVTELQTGPNEVTVRATAPDLSYVETTTTITPETVLPTITAFSAQGIWYNYILQLHRIDGSDNSSGPYKYLVTTTSAKPSKAHTGWREALTTANLNYGANLLHPWIQDAYGNVSDVYPSPIPVQVIQRSPVTFPTVVSFTTPSVVNQSFTIPITAFAGSLSAVAYMITETDIIPRIDDSWWSATPPSTYVVDSYGTKRLYAWVKDSAGYVNQPSTSVSLVVSADSTNIGYGRAAGVSVAVGSNFVVGTGIRTIPNTTVSVTPVSVTVASGEIVAVGSAPTPGGSLVDYNGLLIRTWTTSNGTELIPINFKLF